MHTHQDGYDQKDSKCWQGCAEIRIFITLLLATLEPSLVVA